MDDSEFKSNITIASNIYPRKTHNGNAVRLEEDPSFVAQVSGTSALEATKEQLKYSYKDTHLSPVQLRELEEGLGCSLDRLKEKTFGPLMINGVRVWACRCENVECSRYELCMSGVGAKRILREKMGTAVKMTGNGQKNLTYKALGIDFSEESQEQKLFHPTPKEESTQNETTYDVKSELLLGDTSELPHNYQEIDNPDVIIQSKISEKILVNAGAGTGKTHTVIARLEYIASNHLVEDLSNVLVLCYTKSAELVINQRLEQGVIEKRLPPEVQNICVLTFDSYATKYLEAIEEDYVKLNYNERIKRFNEKIDPEFFDHFEYVIADEIQDLVNERGRMTINILNAVSCAYLLFGDKCQAIYDYESDSEDSMDSVAFYSALEMLFATEGKKYEFYKNRRQSDLLSEFTSGIRRYLLQSSPKEANQRISKQKSTLPTCNKAVFFDSIAQVTGTTAILCRNNGQAELISDLLHEKKINHSLLRQNHGKPSYHRWIADIFWDFCKDYMESEEFMGRFSVRVDTDQDKAQRYFKALRDFSLGDAEGLPGIEKAKLLTALQRNTPQSQELLVDSEEKLVVSTIHKAKGKEFDSVFLVDFPLDETSDSTEEARVTYVALTRPKEKLTLVKKSVAGGFYKKTESQRTYESILKLQKYPYCTRIAVGYENDMSTNYFVSGGFASSLARQHYIATQVKVHDRISLKLWKNTYLVLHGDSQRTIGGLSIPTVQQIYDCVTIRKSSELPLFLHSLYVSNVVTCHQEQISNNTPSQFKESGIWLGVEITGFAKIDWHYGE